MCHNRPSCDLIPSSSSNRPFLEDGFGPSDNSEANKARDYRKKKRIYGNYTEAVSIPEKKTRKKSEVKPPKSRSKSKFKDYRGFDSDDEQLESKKSGGKIIDLTEDDLPITPQKPLKKDSPDPFYFGTSSNGLGLNSLGLSQPKPKGPFNLDRSNPNASINLNLVGSTNIKDEDKFDLEFRNTTTSRHVSNSPVRNQRTLRKPKSNLYTPYSACSPSPSSTPAKLNDPKETPSSTKSQNRGSSILQPKQKPRIFDLANESSGDETEFRSGFSSDVRQSEKRVRTGTTQKSTRYQRRYFMSPTPEAWKLENSTSDRGRRRSRGKGRNSTNFRPRLFSPRHEYKFLNNEEKQPEVDAQKLNFSTSTEPKGEPATPSSPKARKSGVYTTTEDESKCSETSQKKRMRLGSESLDELKNYGDLKNLLEEGVKKFSFSDTQATGSGETNYEGSTVVIKTSNEEKNEEAQILRGLKSNKTGHQNNTGK